MLKIAFALTSIFINNLPVVLTYTNIFNHGHSIALAFILTPDHAYDALLTRALTLALKHVSALLFLKLVPFPSLTNILFRSHMPLRRILSSFLHPHLPTLLPYFPLSPLVPFVSSYSESCSRSSSPPLSILPWFSYSFATFLLLTTLPLLQLTLLSSSPNSFQCRFIPISLNPTRPQEPNCSSFYSRSNLRSYHTFAEASVPVYVHVPMTLLLTRLPIICVPRRHPLLLTQLTQLLLTTLFLCSPSIFSAPYLALSFLFQPLYSFTITVPVTFWSK